MVNDMDEKAHPSQTPASFVAAEQITVMRAAAEPMEMTQEEVEALAKGGAATRKIVERLAARSEAATVLTAKAAPVAFTADELAQIEKSGELPAKLRQRLEDSARLPEETETGVAVTAKGAPTFDPPKS
jgi:hypothetical protein